MKKIIYHNQTEKEAIEYTSKLIDWGLSLLISSALNEVFYSFTMLRQSNLFHHEVKRRAKSAFKIMENKKKMLSEIVLHKGFSETYWDFAIDASDKDLCKLRNAIKDVLIRNNIPSPDLISQIEVTRILLESSKLHYEEIIESCTNKFLSKNLYEMRNLDLDAIFCEFNMTPLFKEWDAMCDYIYSIVNGKVDLNEDSVSEAFDNLANKFAKGEYIDECLKVAKEEFPEFYNTIIKKTE